jgi:hypothetical protein
VSWVAADCSSVPFASWSSGFHGDARAPTTPGLSFFRSFLVRFVLQIQKRFHDLDPHVVFVILDGDVISDCTIHFALVECMCGDLTFHLHVLSVRSNFSMIS